MTEAIQTEMKTCSKCQTVKPVSEYSRDRAKKDGLSGRCKPCTKAYQALWHAENRERRAAYHAQYRAENREPRAAYSAQYSAENPHVNWESGYRIRARALGFEPVVRSFTREDMLTYWNNGPFCIYCDAAWSEIEHLIPVGLGGIHAVENVAPSCGPCNRVNAWTVVRERRAMAAA